MTIQENKVVSLAYELEVDEKDSENRVLADKSEDGNPLVFIFGTGQLLERFEENIQGKQKGDTFSFSISAEEGYGEFDDEAVIELPIETFRVNGELDLEMLQPGSVLPMVDENGNPLQGRVIEISEDDIVTMDFNHPLAGFVLYFKGSVIDVRDATADELSHGHVHGEGGTHH